MEREKKMIDCKSAREIEEESDGSYISSSGKGVFDFPWLHNDEGMMLYEYWKSDHDEYWNFQDTFEYNRQCLLYETQTPTMNDGVWPLEAENGMEMETVDCIWTWMLNHPLQQGHASESER